MGLPGRVFPERLLPALSLLPGATPDHDARQGALPNRLMSSPISAKITSACQRLIPGMVTNKARARSAVSFGGWLLPPSDCGDRLPLPGVDDADGGSADPPLTTSNWLIRAPISSLKAWICSFRKS